LLLAASLAEGMLVVTKQEMFRHAAAFCVSVAALGALGAATLGWFNGGIRVPRRGLDPGDASQLGNIEMGGMFTVLKVRDGISTYDDPGWYRFPGGSVAIRTRS
jgi:hypothetical protein